MALRFRSSASRSRISAGVARRSREWALPIKWALAGGSARGEPGLGRRILLMSRQVIDRQGTQASYTHLERGLVHQEARRMHILGLGQVRGRIRHAQVNEQSGDFFLVEGEIFRREHRV